jgi:hypothetical protein
VLGGPREFVLALRVGEYVDNGKKMRFSLKDV